MADTRRPLSPHLQIYKWQVQMVSSIVHRATGIALAVGTLMVLWGLLALAGGESTFNQFKTCTGSPIGLVLLFGWTWALFYHLCNGIRHLGWDAGLGLDLHSVYLTGWIVVIAAAVLTIGSFIAGYWYLGAL